MHDNNRPLYIKTEQQRMPYGCENCRAVIITQDETTQSFHYTCKYTNDSVKPSFRPDSCPLLDSRAILDMEYDNPEIPSPLLDYMMPISCVYGIVYGSIYLEKLNTDPFEALANFLLMGTSYFIILSVLILVIFLTMQRFHISKILKQAFIYPLNAIKPKFEYRSFLFEALRIFYAVFVICCIGILLQVTGLNQIIISIIKFFATVVI